MQYSDWFRYHPVIEENNEDILKCVRGNCRITTPRVEYEKVSINTSFFFSMPRSLPSRVILSNYHFHHQTLHLSFRNRRLRLQGGTVSVFNHCVDDICEIFRNQLINLQLIVAIK
jgi:hypothetical protein